MAFIHRFSPGDIGRIVLRRDEDRRDQQRGDHESECNTTGHDAPQLFLVVWAMKEVNSCFMFVLLQDGQTTFPVSCSLNVRTTSDSFPQSKHL